MVYGIGRGCFLAKMFRAQETRKPKLDEFDLSESTFTEHQGSEVAVSRSAPHGPVVRTETKSSRSVRHQQMDIPTAL